MQRICLVLLLIWLIPCPGQAQSNLIITRFSPNGTLTWSNLVTNSTCRVEWASSAAGPWTNTWAMLTNIFTGTNATLSANVPMFYRVVMVVPPPPPPPNTNTYNIDYCVVQFPKSLTAPSGSSSTIYARLYIAGLTSQTYGIDSAPALRYQIGYGPTNTAPATHPDWIWFNCSPNYSYSDANIDEYQASIAPLPIGTYEYVCRFSGNYGTNWTYGDAVNNFDGNQPAPNRCLMTVTP